MAMTRKDYVVLANAIGLAMRNAEVSEMAAMRQMRDTIVLALMDDNTRFDADVFTQHANEVMGCLRDIDGRRIKA
jgi:hypothetical protein